MLKAFQGKLSSCSRQVCWRVRKTKSPDWSRHPGTIPCLAGLPLQGQEVHPHPLAASISSSSHHSTPGAHADGWPCHHSSPEVEIQGCGCAYRLLCRIEKPEWHPALLRALWNTTWGVLSQAFVAREAAFGAEDGPEMSQRRWVRLSTEKPTSTVYVLGTELSLDVCG